MTALRWLTVGAVTTAAYATYLLMSAIDSGIPLIPSRLNSLVIGGLAVAGLTLILDYRNERRHAQLLRSVARIQHYLDRLDGPTEQLHVVGSVRAAATVVDTRARAEVVELGDRIRRQLSSE